MSERTIAVALHGIEPATFERCALIRDWLCDNGIDRVTLLVIPARDMHPVGERAPEMVRWLSEQRRAGDAIAQHGFRHVCAGRRGGEFSHLGGAETRAAVNAGWRVLKLAGIEPDGFVAPSYSYTAALRDTLGQRFRWWASLLRVHRTGAGEHHEPLAPAWSLRGGGRLNRLLSPGLVRAASLLPNQSLRIDLHPGDLRHTRHMLALEWVLSRVDDRAPVTYGQLAGV